MDQPMQWRKSSFTSTSCVEVAVAGESIAVRNSNQPDAGTLMFTPAEMSAWIRGVQAGEFNDLVI
jgi:hypothetical protein